MDCWKWNRQRSFTLWTLIRCNLRYGINFPSQLSLGIDKRESILVTVASLGVAFCIEFPDRQRNIKRALKKNDTGNLIERLPIPDSCGKCLDAVLLEIPLTEKLEQLLNHVQQNLHKKTTVQMKVAMVIMLKPALLDRTGLHSDAGASFSLLWKSYLIFS